MSVTGAGYMDSTEKIQFLHELIASVSGIACWVFDEDKNIIACSHPDTETVLFLGRIIREDNIWKNTVDHLHESDYPIIISINAGLTWTAYLQNTENGQRIHMIGPAMGDFSSISEMRRALRPWKEKVEQAGGNLMDIIYRMQQLPAVSYMDMNKYSLMLYYTLTGRSLQMSDLRVVRVSAVREHSKIALAPSDRHRQWMAEEAILRMIREGDMNYREVFNRHMSVKNIWIENTGTSIENAVLSCSIMAVLGARAAVEGGLPADTAYTLSNQYIRDYTRCDAVAEVQSISMNMLQDYVSRVHKIRTENTYSEAVKNSTEYIMMHIEEPFDITFLAQRLGYTPYYFTRKFHRETGIGLNDYIRQKRLERSLLYLETSEMPIAEIASKLSFSSATHYTDAFRDQYKVTPAKWRREHRFR